MRRKRLAVKILIWSLVVIWLAGMVFIVGPHIRYGIYPCCYKAASQNQTDGASQEISGVPQNHSMTQGQDASAYQRYAAEWAEPMVLLTIVLAIGVLATAIIYYRQLKKMEEAVRLNTEQGVIMRDSLVETRKMTAYSSAAAQAAWKSVEIAEKQLIHDQRARIVVQSFTPTMSDEQVLRLENTGKLAADPVDVFVDMIVLVPPKLAAEYPNELREGFDHVWWFNIGRVITTHELIIPLGEHLNGRESVAWHSGELRIVAQIEIKHGDGFGNIDTPRFAFRSHGGKWITWNTWTATSKEDRIAEEQANYHPK